MIMYSKIYIGGAILLKKLIIPLVLIIIILSSTGNVFAAGSSPAVLEVPDVKIVIDGAITPCKDVPISINQRTLLPLRELLVNLGVQDDNEHISWNGQDQSVTVYKDTTKLYLKLGSKTAYVNDKPVQLDVAPVVYNKNQRTYIPLRFVSDTLGKKVVWDGSSKSILIRDAVEFNKIKDILDKSDSAMEKIAKCKLVMNMDANFKMNQLSMDMTFDISSETDRMNKDMHMLMKMNMLGMTMDVDSYFCDNASYINNPATGSWEKQVYTAEEYDKVFNEQDDTSILKANEVLCAGLVISQAAGSDETLLKGDVYMNELFDKAMAGNDSQALSEDKKIDYSKFYLEIVIDNKTNLLKSMKMNIAGTQPSEEGDTTISMDINAVYSEYDGSFEIVVPEDVLKNAVESSTDDSIM